MFLPILNSESIIARIPSVRILLRKLLNSSFGYIFSNFEFLWRYLNSRNLKIGNQNSDKNSVCRNSIKKSAEFNSFFHIFFSFGTFYHGWSRRFHPFSWTRDHRKVCYTIHKKWLYISFAVSYFYIKALPK